MPVDPSPTVLDHMGSTATNPSPVTRNFDAAGFQEGDQDEPAKKKVRCFRCSDPVDIIDILGQETSRIDLSTDLHDVWENGLTGVEKGPSSPQIVTRLSDGACNVGSARTQDALQRLRLTVGETSKEVRRHK